jgi:predicted ABC-type ATPase
MRMFAGPNNSGKSVLKSYLPTPLLGVYLNADNTHTWLAEITDGSRMEFKTGQIPAWFKRAVLDKVARRQPE